MSRGPCFPLHSSHPYRLSLAYTFANVVKDEVILNLENEGIADW
jgi:hypothetical protein